MLSAKQKKIASKAGDPNKIDAKDFAVLKAEKAKGRGMGLQDEQLPPGKMVAAKKGKMIKKKSDGKAEKGMGIEKKMSGGMMSDGAAEKGMGIEKKMGGGMIDPTMANYQKGGSVMARGNRIARIRPTKLY
jgi:hypothetical protein